MRDYRQGSRLIADGIEFSQGLPSFNIVYHGEDFGRCSLKIPGTHNISNAFDKRCGIFVNRASPASMAKALSEFGGADGRFYHQGQIQGCTGGRRLCSPSDRCESYHRGGGEYTAQQYTCRFPAADVQPQAPFSMTTYQSLLPCRKVSVC